MSAVLLATHAWIWSLLDSARLGGDAKTAILDADVPFPGADVVVRADALTASVREFCAKW